MTSANTHQRVRGRILECRCRIIVFGRIKGDLIWVSSLTNIEPRLGQDDRDDCTNIIFVLQISMAEYITSPLLQPGIPATEKRCHRDFKLVVVYYAYISAEGNTSAETTVDPAIGNLSVYLSRIRSKEYSKTMSEVNLQSSTGDIGYISRIGMIVWCVGFHKMTGGFVRWLTKLMCLVTSYLHRSLINATQNTFK